MNASIVPRADSDSPATIVCMPGTPNHVPNAQIATTPECQRERDVVSGRRNAAVPKNAIPIRTVRRGTDPGEDDRRSIRAATIPTTPTTR